jgi:hypothetical protein
MAKCNRISLDGALAIARISVGASIRSSDVDARRIRRGEVRKLEAAMGL